ncbi:hypothetical protein FRB94_003603 [Tulasnella sp. JGI-2019a]|nr:hypothetical protein FRB94_003603 [Tulasnella sp. JGI-2019a]KAG9029860.1 hypothetical protein FRB95_004778 [Tulasnella sp. JGI-2019a]
MSSDKPIPILTSTTGSFVAPTPQNTPLVAAPISGGLSKPTVPDIAEDLEELDIDDDGNDDEDDGDEDDEDVKKAKTAAIQATMLGMVQGKLAGLIGKSSGYIESLPLPVRRRVEGLKGVHQEYTKLELAYKREVLELDKKYLALYNPVFDRRQKILIGEAEPTEEEVKLGEEQSLKDDPDAEPLAEDADKDKDADVKGIPDFWLTALRNHLDISELITERDEGAMHSLKDIRLEYLTDKDGYTIHFHFSPNEYFTNTILSKTYYYTQGEADYDGDFMFSHAEGTKIAWKEDKDLTKEYEIRKQRNKNTNRTRTVRKAKDTPSFFDFFSPPSKPPVDDPGMDEEELDVLEFKLEMDYSIGEDLKEKIIPRAIDYFTGKALEYDTDYDDDDEEDEEGMLEEDDDDDEEDSDEGAYVPPLKKKGGKGGAGRGGGGGDKPEECKNQ